MPLSLERIEMLRRNNVDHALIHVLFLGINIILGNTSNFMSRAK